MIVECVWGPLDGHAVEVEGRSDGDRIRIPSLRRRPDGGLALVYHTYILEGRRLRWDEYAEDRLFREASP